MRFFEKKRSRGTRTVYQHQNTKNKRFVLRGVLLGIMFLVVGSFIWIILEQFRVTTIECQFDAQPCPEEFVTASQTVLGRHIFAIQVVPIPGYSVKITRHFPNRILVDVQKPIPVIIFLQPSNDYVAVTSDGFLIPASNPDPLISQITDTEVSQKKPGDTIDSSRVNMYKELKSAWSRTLAESIRSVTIESPEKIILSTAEGSDVIVNAGKLTSQLHSLQQLLLTPTIDLAGKEVDLRFTNPVIREKTS
ncbi:hypothetical protein KBD71_03185 [Candidatus Woesebacteria bacterium]|nr:hypothetical protein [Candidatus Woesebacteria bacterium]